MRPTADHPQFAVTSKRPPSFCQWLQHPVADGPREGQGREELQQPADTHLSEQPKPATEDHPEHAVASSFTEDGEGTIQRRPAMADDPLFKNVIEPEKGSHIF